MAGNRKSAKVSVIIPTRNRADLLAECLHSVLRQSLEPMEVFVMDDDSSDDTAGIVSGLGKQDSRLLYTRSRHHAGMAALLNHGASMASSPYLLMVCDRMVLESDCIEKLLLSFHELTDQGARPGAVGPRLIGSPPSGEIGNSIVRVDDSTGEIYHNYGADGTLAVEVPTLHHWCLISKTAFAEAGSYSTSFRGNHWRLDSDLHQRIRRQGYQLFFEPQARASYRQANSGGNRVGPVSLRYYTIRNHLLYLARNHQGSQPRMATVYLTRLLIRNMKG